MIDAVLARCRAVARLTLEVAERVAAAPLTRTSKCRWTPVEWPVVPMPPTTVPCPTLWPTETARLDMWP